MGLFVSPLTVCTEGYAIAERYHNLTTQSSNTHQTASARTNLQAQECRMRMIRRVAMLIIAPLPEVVKPRNSRKSADFFKDADGKRPTPPQRTYEGL